MQLWSLLLASPEGKMSLAVIAFMIGMGIWFAWWFSKNMKNSQDESDKK